MKPVTVMLVDDSAFIRKVVSDILNQEADIEVIAAARDGVDALEKMRHHDPDIIMLDVDMPRMDGLAFLKIAMADKARRILMLSALTGKGDEATVQALAEGALDFIHKPSGNISLDIEHKAAEIISKVRSLAAVTDAQLASVLAGTGTARGSDAVETEDRECRKMIFIACSTGGPRTLSTLLGCCRPLHNSGMVIVQHMPGGFTRSLARRLDEVSPIRVSEGSNHDRLLVNHAILAPGGKHLVADRSKRVHLNDGPAHRGLKPCADLTLLSLIEVFQGNILGVVLTGMGKDALEGCRVLKSRGGYIVAQDQATSLIYGMPRVVVDSGLADWVLSLEDIPESIREWDES